MFGPDDFNYQETMRTREAMRDIANAPMYDQMGLGQQSLRELSHDMGETAQGVGKIISGLSDLHL